MLNDTRNLKESGTASVAELREFLKTLKARNPQEVIGIVSSSLLIQSVGISCVATAAILAVFTVAPYFIYGPRQAKAAAAKPAMAAAADATRPASDSTAGSNADSTGSAATPGVPDAAKAAKVMGLDEAKSADPKKNPLDKPDLDKLLDGL